jgi:transcriptional regulator GlxA family with amidase domain
MKAILFLSPAQPMTTFIASILKQKNDFFKWLRECVARNVNICSVCTGAIILGQAGLLDGIECTTHWRRIPELRQRFPNAKVIEDVLFVKSRISARVQVLVQVSISLYQFSKI